MIRLSKFTGSMTQDALSGETLAAYVGAYGTDDATLDDLLNQANAPLLSDRRPILLQGELANPYRLQEMGVGPLPLLPVRLEGICRTWADGLDRATLTPESITLRWPELPVGGRSATLVWPPESNSN